jgi:hypothetical protein
MDREDIRFRSGDAECAGWLFRPVGPSRASCVVLAHGFAGVMEARLGAYAERFAEAGHTALVFDYRHFGESGGEPRQLLDVGRQLDDWRAAIRHARSLEGVDPARIAIWGTSFSGGHVLAIAAEDPRVAAVISQTPHMSGTATLRAAGLADLARLTRAGLRDQARALARRDPYLAPAVADPGELGAMTSEGAKAGYLALFADGAEWRNEVAARIFLRIALYSPGRRAPKVGAPLLIQVGARDLVTPPAPASKAARRAPRGELREYESGHWEVYVPPLFEAVVADQLEFLDRSLGSGPSS